jgi:hypothetical protein
METRNGRWRAVALFAAGAVVGTLFAATPAGAHFQSSLSHLTSHMKQVFYTKGQANARFVEGNVRIVPFAYDAPEATTTPKRVLLAEGLSLDVKCLSPSGDPILVLNWLTATNNARASRLLNGAGSLQNFDQDPDWDAGEAFAGDNNLTGPVQGTTAYTNAKGGGVTVHWSSMATGIDDRCRLMGYAMVDPAG